MRQAEIVAITKADSRLLRTIFRGMDPPVSVREQLVEVRQSWLTDCLRRHALCSSCRETSTLIALGQFPAPVVVSVSSKLIESGKATEMTARMRQSASERWEIARRVLPEFQAAVAYTNHLGWLPLPRRWRAENFADRTRSMGTAVTAASAFAVSTRFAISAVRVCLGAPASLEVLESALTVIASILRDESVVSPPPY